MQIVIDIPNEYYEDIKEHGGLYGYCSGLVIASEVVSNGTPLPKGHGRLIDADATLKIIDVEYPNVDRKDIKKIVEDAPTIIEATEG